MGGTLGHQPVLPPARPVWPSVARGQAVLLSARGPPGTAAVEVMVLPPNIRRGPVGCSPLRVSGPSPCPETWSYHPHLTRQGCEERATSATPGPSQEPGCQPTPGGCWPRGSGRFQTPPSFLCRRPEHSAPPRPRAPHCLPGSTALLLAPDLSNSISLFLFSI